MHACHYIATFFYIKVANTFSTQTQQRDANDEPIMGGGGPLERTRIHPESYLLANRIASDALEEEEGESTLERAMHPQNRCLVLYLYEFCGININVCVSFGVERFLVFDVCFLRGFVCFVVFDVCFWKMFCMFCCFHCVF